MKEKHGLKKLLIFTMTGALTLTGAGTAFAASSGTSERAERFQAHSGNFAAWNTVYPDVLESLTDDGTITQEQADAISEAMSPAKDQTDETADRPAKPDRAAASGETAEKPAERETTSGAISARTDGTRPEGGRMKGMRLEGAGSQGTEAEGTRPERARFEGTGTDGNEEEKEMFTGEHKSPLDELVSDGTLTQEEADAVLEALKEARDSGETCDEILDTLVSEEVITQEQADAIVDAMPVLEEKGSAQMHGNLLSELVSDGTITQEQADAVLDAVKTAMEAAREAAKTSSEDTDEASE